METGADFNSPESWPSLPLDEWKDTYATLHRWMQIVGKVRMALSPPLNHFWHAALYVTSRGLSTPPLAWGGEALQISFDFIDHALIMEHSSGDTRILELAPRTVADFYREFMASLRLMGVHLHINPMPQELPDTLPFDRDTLHASYQPEYAHRCWRILLAANAVFQEFRSRYLGKCSPVHFFWGSFDLAVTRFSGRPAPPRPGADFITREAYSHECSSAGWWPGGETLSGTYVEGPAFYAYAAPQPTGFAERKVSPKTAYYDPKLGEFLLRYDDMRHASSPREALLDFLQSTYEAAADLGHWTRAALEEPEGWLARGGKHAA